MIGRVIAAAALTLSLTATAHAATMFAGPLIPEANEEGLQCGITNVGVVTQNVTIQIYGAVSGEGNGALIESLGPFAISPLETATVAAGSAFPQFPHVCKFTVPNKALYRAVACIKNNVSQLQTTCVLAQ